MKANTPLIQHWSRRRALQAAAGAIVLLTLDWHCSPRPSLESLDIVQREAWGAAEPDQNAPEEHGLYSPTDNPNGWLVYQEPLAEILNTIVVHHSALPLNDGPLEIQQKHMLQRGFADIAYHYVINADGRIFAGRELNVRGAHTGGHNTGTVGSVLLGNFENTHPTDLQLDSLKMLCGCLADHHSISHLAGHQDFQPGVTLCPGRNLEVLLPNLAAELGLEFGTGGYVG